MMTRLQHFLGYIDGSEQDSSNPSVLAMELLQSCVKSSILPFDFELKLRVTSEVQSIFIPGCNYLSMPFLWCWFG